MLKIYGSPLCPYCVACREDLDRAGIQYVYMDITGNLLYMKKFLKLREDPAFARIRERGQIGIPCILGEDGSIAFEWKQLLE